MNDAVRRWGQADPFGETQRDEPASGSVCCKQRRKNSQGEELPAALMNY